MLGYSVDPLGDFLILGNLPMPLEV